jgi:hypothetical protein
MTHDCSATPASRARRATPGSPPKRSAIRRARSIGSAWKSCHPAEPVPWLRLWRWRISSAAMAKRFDRRIPVISGASSDASWAPSRRAGRRCSGAMSSNAMIVAQRASLTTPALWADPVMGSRRRLDRALAPVAAYPAHHYEARLRSAISLSDGWNAPRRRCGGTIDSMASSFSVGSPRV